MENKKGNKFLFCNTLTALNVLERFIFPKTSIRRDPELERFEVCRLNNMLGAFLLPLFPWSWLKEEEGEGKSFRIGLKSAKCRCKNSHQNQSLSAVCFTRSTYLIKIFSLRCTMVTLLNEEDISIESRGWRMRNVNLKAVKVVDKVAWKLFNLNFSQSNNWIEFEIIFKSKSLEFP